MDDPEEFRDPEDSEPLWVREARRRADSGTWQADH